MDQFRDIVFVPITEEMINQWLNPNIHNTTNCVPLSLYFLRFIDYTTYVQLDKISSQQKGFSAVQTDYIMQTLENINQIPTERVRSGVVNFTQFSDNEILYEKMQPNTACAILIERQDKSGHMCILARVGNEFTMLDPQTYVIISGLQKIHDFFNTDNVVREWILTRKFEEAQPEKRRRIAGGKNRTKKQKQIKIENTLFCKLQQIINSIYFFIIIVINS